MNGVLGKRIRRARLDTGLSHDKFAALVGTNRSHLIKLEKGTHTPRAAMLKRIAEASGKPLGFFYSEPIVDPQERLEAAMADVQRALLDAVAAAVARAAGATA